MSTNEINIEFVFYQDDYDITGINKDGTETVEEESEIFDLNAIEYTDADSEEEERELTEAMIAKSTRRIRKYFHGRENTPKDVTMGDISDKDIDMSVNVPNAFDLNFDEPVNFEDPPVQQVPRTAPHSSHQPATQGVSQFQLPLYSLYNG
jgi:hypothetical protein